MTCGGKSDVQETKNRTAAAVAAADSVFFNRAFIFSLRF
jgi:hypothetical protein